MPTKYDRDEWDALVTAASAAHQRGDLAECSRLLDEADKVKRRRDNGARRRETRRRYRVIMCGLRRAIRAANKIWPD